MLILMRTPLILALAAALLAGAARADELSDQFAAQRAAAKKQAADQAARQAAQAPLRAGRTGPAAFAQGVMKSSADWLKETPDIVQFVNENGCAIVDGKYAEVRMHCPAAAAAGAAAAAACADFSKAVDATAKSTELVVVDRATMRALTNNPQALAFGVTKELKARLVDPANPDRPVVLGDPAKNTIALRGDPVEPGTKAPSDGVFSLVLAHEFLHIALRQLDNPALGGGARKSVEDPAIANLHHRLTDALNWKAVGWNQSDAPWQKGAAPGCAKAGQPAPAN